jgi:hypothetical protein
MAAGEVRPGAGWAMARMELIYKTKARL